MRTSSVAIAFVCAGGCYAALPPPVPPRVTGSVESEGGGLGTWRIAVSRGIAPHHVDALDLVDPAAPDRTLRLVVPEPEPDQLPRGIQEHVAARAVELRVANRATGREVVLDRTHCARLDAILRATGGEVFGSARFDCQLGDGGHVRGDVELAGGHYGRMRPIDGHLEASDDTLGRASFAPDQAELDPRGALFWDHRHPRVVFDVEQLPDDASILGTGANAVLRITSTAERVQSFELQPSACRVLRLERVETGYVRVGTHQHTSWSGKLDVDCATPSGGRLTASLGMHE